MTELAGRRLLAEGREAEIYEWDAGRVLRLMRTAKQRPAMDRSTLAIEAAIRSGVPTPAVIETVEVDGRPGQVMDRVDGPDQLALIGTRPWKLPAIARSFGRIHAELHRTVVPDGLPTVHDHLRGRVEGSPLVPAAIAEAALVALDDLPSGTALCHGDYHPGNVLVTANGAVVIDWTNAVRGDPMADLAHTRLMLRVAALPPGAPPVIRLLAGGGRGALTRLYVRAYRRAGNLDRALADRWEPVRAADRLVDSIDGEREAVLAVCRRGLGLNDAP